MHGASAQTLCLKLSSPSLTFSDSQPQLDSDVPALENPISATVTYSGEGVVHIFMLANGNMTSISGNSTISAAKIYWSGVGTGYESGHLCANEEIEAANGTLATSESAGWDFFLKHGLYDSGTYQLSITVMAAVE